VTAVILLVPSSVARRIIDTRHETGIETSTVARVRSPATA
jgi:hypothetical protein